MKDFSHCREQRRNRIGRKRPRSGRADDRRRTPERARALRTQARRAADNANKSCPTKDRSLLIPLPPTAGAGAIPPDGPFSVCRSPPAAKDCLIETGFPKLANRARRECHGAMMETRSVSLGSGAVIAR